MTVTEHLRKHYFERVGMLKEVQRVDIESLRKSEWSIAFERLMRNRLIMGAIRYGKLHDNCKPKYDRIESIISRLHKYNQTGNKEYLVDIANLCLLEFEEGTGHFQSIDDGEHVNKI